MKFVCFHHWPLFLFDYNLIGSFNLSSILFWVFSSKKKKQKCSSRIVEIFTKKLTEARFVRCKTGVDHE